MLKSDILVIGTGIAGLSFAIKTALKRKDLHITIMAKDKAEITNTKYAQGGIAVVMDTLKDSFAHHIKDTIMAGGGCCDEEVVKMVVEQAPLRLAELLELGVTFDKDNDRSFNLALEGGHSTHRILHHGDLTGFEIERALLTAVRQTDNITLLENHFVIDLLTEDNQCCGAFFISDDGRMKYFRSKVTVLSTGGCGQVFRHTTNSPIATGDGVAIAERAKARIDDMQYIQFHPTALYEPGKNPYFLLSEALRGFGAHIVNANGKRFLFKYDTRGELATRDIVSKAIFAEMQHSGRDYVYLDCRHLDPLQLKVHFPSIISHCHSIGIDPLHTLLPIVPVAHYQCGGVTVNKLAQTTVGHLYAIGECARTGLHGKNRLASNSLLEAVVYAHQASSEICRSIDSIPLSATVLINKYPDSVSVTNVQKFCEFRADLQESLEDYFLGEPHKQLQAIHQMGILKNSILKCYEEEELSKPLIELANMLTVATLIIENSQENILITS